jgi:hypothetical protein
LIEIDGIPWYTEVALDESGCEETAACGHRQDLLWCILRTLLLLELAHLLKLFAVQFNIVQLCVSLFFSFQSLPFFPIAGGSVTQFQLAILSERGHSGLECAQNAPADAKRSHVPKALLCYRWTNDEQRRLQSRCCVARSK